MRSIMRSLNRIYLLLLSVFFITTCNGQIKTQPKEIVSEPKTITNWLPKILKPMLTFNAASIDCGWRINLETFGSVLTVKVFISIVNVKAASASLQRKMGWTITLCIQF